MSDKPESLLTRLVNRVFPRMPDFYGLMNEQCDVLVEAMDAFVQYMEESSKENARRVRLIEKRGDELKARNLDILNRAFSTPMDREDIYHAITTLDMGMNYAKTTTREVEVLSIVPDKYMLEMAMEYRNAATALQRGYRTLSTNPVQGEEAAAAVRKAERNIEKIYRRALAELFDATDMLQVMEANAPDAKTQAVLRVVEMFKRREIYRHLSNGADRLARASERLHDIIVKIS